MRCVAPDTQKHNSPAPNGATTAFATVAPAEKFTFDATDEGGTGKTQRSHSADSHAGVSSVSEPRRSAWAPLWSQP